MDRCAQGVGDLAGPGLGVGVDGVGVVEVAQHVGQALLDPGQVGVVADVAAEVVADQHPTEVVEDPEPADRGLRAVTGRAVPDQVRSAAGVGAHRAHGVHVRVVAVRLAAGGIGRRSVSGAGVSSVPNTSCSPSAVLSACSNPAVVSASSRRVRQQEMNPVDTATPSSADIRSAVRSMPEHVLAGQQGRRGGHVRAVAGRPAPYPRR